MHFWSGSTVDSKEIADISAYNRANGFMWLTYATVIALSGVLSLFNTWVGVALLVVTCTVGIAVIFATYKRIYGKYKSK